MGSVGSGKCEKGVEVGLGEKGEEEGKLGSPRQIWYGYVECEERRRVRTKE